MTSERKWLDFGCEKYKARKREWCWLFCITQKGSKLIKEICVWPNWLFIFGRHLPLMLVTCHLEKCPKRPLWPINSERLSVYIWSNRLLIHSCGNSFKWLNPRWFQSKQSGSEREAKNHSPTSSTFSLTPLPPHALTFARFSRFLLPPCAEPPFMKIFDVVSTKSVFRIAMSA